MAIVLSFAFAYFLSALLRAVTATLAPVFSSELGLQPADLGLLAGAYFLGFASLQLPLGRALDRFGPRRVQMVLLSLAVVGCAAFSQARGLLSLSAARLLIGMGVAACLMAPLTCYRHIFDASTQLRLNSWMLMTGSLGMLASTLPVQMAAAATGAGAACSWPWPALLLVSLLLIAWFAPKAAPARPGAAWRALPRHHAPPDVRGAGAAGLLQLRRPDRRAVAVGRPVADAGVGPQRGAGGARACSPST